MPGVNSVTLSWTNPADPAPEGVYVEVVGAQSRVIAVPGAVGSTVVSGLRNGVEYSFRVTAATRHGSASASDTVEATPTTGVEGVVAGLIVEFAPGVDDAPGTQEVPGEQALSVDVEIAADVTDRAVLVELAEPVSVDEAEAIAAGLESSPQVEWAEPDQFLFTSTTTSETSSGNWNLSGTYGVDAGQSADAATAGDGVTVAVIDTGITGHPQLDSRIVPGFDFVSSPEQLSAVRQANPPPVAFDGDYVDESTYGAIGRDSNPADPGDWNTARSSSWHGTKMAGLIADVAPGASIQPVRALSWRGGLLSDIAASIAWASGGEVSGTSVNANPAKVINMSFAVEAMCPTALQYAIDGARSRGAILVAAAGNANDDASRYAPGNCNGVITVGATTSTGVRAVYSNYGSVVDISAPGGDNAAPVVSASNTGTTSPDQPTTAGDFGTSVAAAHVSAAAAALAAGDPSVTPDAAYRTLTGKDHVKAFANPTCDANPDYGCGAGILTLGPQLAQIAVAGDTDYYMNFNGTNQRAKASAGYYPVANGGGQAFTVSAWVYDNVANEPWKYVASQQQDSSATAFFLGTVNNSQEIIVSAWFTGVFLPVGQWVHVAVTRVGSNAALYLNGVVVAVTSNYVPDWQSNNQPFRVGSFVDDRAEFWNGRIDQVKVYNYDLSATQVASDMQTWGQVSGANTDSLIAHYDLNEGSGSTVINRGYQGTAYSLGNLATENGPTWTTLVSPSTSGSTTTVQFNRSYLTSTGGWTAPAGVSSGTALIVGGGGGGGYDGGGGGGGGGVWTGNVSLNAGAANMVTVGQGGAPRKGYDPGNNCLGGNSGGAIGCNGNNGTTSIFASVGATGGGGGGGKNAAGSNAATSTTDGSGGGGGGNDFTAQQAGGSGRYSGGRGGATTDPARTMGGGGGGVNGAGSDGNGNNNTSAGSGGTGFASSMTGSSLYYGTGGSGGAWINCSFCIVNMTAYGAGTGGYGLTSPTNGTPNQGGGGGGGGGGLAAAGGYGGSGVVILTYSTVPGAPTSVTATAGQQQATVSWVAPTFTGGSSITGYSVVSSPAGATCTPSPATATTCTATGLTAGTAYTFTVTPSNANGNGTAVTSNSATPFGSLAKFAVTTTGGATLGTQVAGTAFDVKITAQDSGNRTVTSFTGTVDLTSTSLFGAGGGTTGTFTAGVLSSRSVTLNRAGASQTITATQTGVPSIVGSSAAFTINAGTATQLQTLLPGETADPGTVSGKTGSPTAQASGASFTTTVNAVDANWNVVTSSTPTVHLTSTDGSASLPANAALVAGTKAFTVTLNTMGSQTITASDTAGSSPLASSTSAAVSVGKPAQATLTVTSTNGEYGSALTLTTSGGSGTGAVTYAAVPGTALGCTVTGDSLAVTQAGTCLVTATKAEDANYAQATSVQTTVTFAKAPQAAFTITSASTVMFGESVTLTTGGGSGTGVISFTPGGSTGTASCLVSSGSTNSVTGTAAGGTCEVIGEKAADDNYLQVLTSQWVTVTTRPITVTASSPSVVYGAGVMPSLSVSSGSLAFSNAISGATYTFTGTGSTSYGPTDLTPSNVGTYSVMPSAATFSNGAAANYDILYAAGTVTISQAPQTITFAQPSGVTYGAAPYALAPTASSGLPVTLTTGTPLVCTVASNIVTITGAGTCTLTASQTGNSNYSTAPSISHNFSVAQASQAALSISSSSSASFGQTISLATSGGSGTGAVTYAVAGPSTCSVSGSTLTLGDAGSACVVTATKAGDTNYTSVSSTAQTVTIGQAGQIVTFTSAVPSSVEFGNTYTPAVTVLSTVTAIDSGVTASFAVSGNCTLAGGLVTFGLPGTCTVTGSALGNTNFTAAPNATQVISIGTTNQSITFAQPSNVSYGSSSVSMGATASSNGDVTYALGVGTTNSACSVSTLGVVTILAVGTCEVVASAAAFDQYAAASDVARAFQVLPALATAPTITSASAANQSMTIGFTAPGFTGGVAVTAYQLVATPVGSGTTVTSNACTTSPCTITGLANGTAYTVTVAAINAAGVGPASAASTSLTAATSANSVGGLYAIPGNNQVTLVWTALTPGQAGGGNFVRYDIYMRLSGTSSWSLVSNSLTSQSNDNITIPSLSNGSSYDFRVVAITDINGTQTAGNTTDVSEYAATTASVPRDVEVLASTATEVQVSWQAPLSDGGAPLIAPYYSVTITSTTPGATTPITCTFASATDRFCTSDSSNPLTNDAVYTITVEAINRIGSSTSATTTYAVPSSIDTLSDLTLNGGAVALAPSFVSATTTYSSSVSYGTSAVSVTPTTTSPAATVTVGGVAVTSGSASAPIALAVGVNTIEVVVTASDIRYSETYTITITRAPAPAAGLPTDGLAVPGRVVPVPASLTNGGSQVAVLLDGVEQSPPTSSANSTSSGLEITGSDYALSISARNINGQPYPLNARGVMQVPQGGSLVLSGSGTAANTSVVVFAIPVPSTRMTYRSSDAALYLGAATTDAAGAFTATLTIPATTALGSYVLQVNTVTPANQVRSINVLLDVVTAAQAKAGQMREAAFYKGKSDSLTKAGKAKLRAMVEAIPSGAEGVEVSVVGVSVSLPTRAANIRLARERAETVADYLEARGIKGHYSVTISTAYDVRDSRLGDRAESADQPMTSSTGKPLTTTSISFTAPTP